MDKNVYYSPNDMLSHNRLLNFIIGSRGIGKSYSMKKYVISRFIKTGEQFIYLRRFKEELTKINMFFDDVIKEFPDHEFKVEGKEFFIDGDLAGYAIPLSRWQKEKSNAYPSVTTIIFDEFIRQKDLSRYLPNEVDAFLNFVDTVIRNRDNLRVVCLSNATTITNPYFMYFKLTPNKNKRFSVNDEILIEIPDSRNFINERTKTKFGKLIKETHYGRMALKNEFTEDSDVFIEQRSKQSVFKFCIIYRGKTYGVWLDSDIGKLYLSDKYDPSTKYKYSLSKTDMNKGYMYVRNYRTNYHLKQMIEFFKLSALRFENQTIKNIGYDILNDMNIV